MVDKEEKIRYNHLIQDCGFKRAREGAHHHGCVAFRALFASPLYRKEVFTVKRTGKTVKVLLTGVLTSGLLLSGCGAPADGNNSNGNSEQNVIEQLNIAFAPYDSSETIMAATKPLCNMLQEKLAEKGYEVKDIQLSVGASYEAVGEALSAGSADVGFISGGTYVLYEEECDVLLTALRAAYSKDSENPADWNDGTPGTYSDEMSSYYRSIILAGPSETGRALAAKVNAGESLSWDDLSGAVWTVMSASSASGYIYPALWLNEHYGKTIADLPTVIQSDSYSTSMARLAAGQADIAVGFAHLQYKYADQWSDEFGGTGSVWEDTNVLGVTEGIFNDTVSVSKTSPIMTPTFRQALGEALIEIGETSEGLAIIQTFAHTGYAFANDSDYDGERAAQTLLKSLQ